MLNLFKKNYVLLLAAVLCLSLTACADSDGSVNGGIDIGGGDVGGTDWRTTGVWRSDGTITRDGEDTNVLVCVHKADATFYYDTEDQTLFGSVEYPITLEGDAWKMFQGIDFTDLDDDGNSDVTMWFIENDEELQIVWFWDAGSEQFVYQPEESWLGFDVEQNWDDDEDWDGDENRDDDDSTWDNTGDDEPGRSDTWSSELFQRDVAEFEGVWYYDDDPSATKYIVIDGHGNWSFYQRTSGDAEATETDYGTFSYATDIGSGYYADSALHDDLSLIVVELDDGVLVWGDEGVYYRTE